MTYQWRKFKNEARTDGLELEHWVKCFRDHLGKIRPESEGEYKYAKYDRKVGKSSRQVSEQLNLPGSPGVPPITCKHMSESQQAASELLLTPDLSCRCLCSDMMKKSGRMLLPKTLTGRERRPTTCWACATCLTSDSF